MKSLKSQLTEAIVDELWEHGRMTAERAAATKQTRTITGNQMDAYGWAVYHNGELKRKGHVTEPQMAKKKPTSGEFGRYYLDRYFEELPDTGLEEVVSGFSLVVCNAMWYTAIHEAGATPSGRIYRVVSQAWGFMREARGLKDLKKLITRSGASMTFSTL